MATADEIRAAAQLQATVAAQADLIKELQAKLAPAPVAAVVMKRYYSSMPFINVPVMRAPGHCTNVTFIRHILDTDDVQVQETLDKMVTRGDVGFSEHPFPNISQEELEMQADVKAAAATAHAKMLAAGLPTA